MKYIYYLILAMLSPLCTMAQTGWPEKYEGVMLQGFYWDSYKPTSWTSLTGQADELSQSFRLIWVPQSGWCNTDHDQMGYAPIWWFRHDSAFGTEAELRQMISTFREKNVGVIEDVVINHRAGNTNWCDFPEESWNGTTYTWSLADICRGDNGGQTVREGYDLTGHDDTGDDFDGARDLDHTSTHVQDNIKGYLDFLLQDLGYAGFRYDMVKGYGGEYVGIYNQHAKPTYSVGEYWDSDYNRLTGWIKATGMTSAAFDFNLKYIINDAFNNGNWAALSMKGMAGDPNMSRYAITFVDNHDTWRNDGDKLHRNVLAANAFILALPGTPCVFWPHWEAYKSELQKMIAARNKAGITNQSKIIRGEYVNGGYVTEVQGEHHRIMVVSGFAQGLDVSGYEAVSVGNETNGNYAYYISREEVSRKEAHVYIKADTQPVYLYAWDASGTPITSAFPGDVLAVRRLVDGETFYSVTLKGDKINFLLNQGGDEGKTADVTDVEGDLFYTYDAGRCTDVTARYQGKTVSAPLSPLAYDEAKPTAFFEAPATWKKVRCHAWDTRRNNLAYNGEWPGAMCEPVGKADNGNTIWRWVYQGQIEGLPDKIIFNTEGDQTGDMTFVNGGYYQRHSTQPEHQGLSASALLRREFAQGVTSTVCLPFDVSADELKTIDGRFYAFSSEQDGVFHFREVSQVEAFKPYLFVATSTGACLRELASHTPLSGQPIPVTINGYGFVGTMTAATVKSTDAQRRFCYRASDGSFVELNKTDGATVAAGRCYFYAPAGSTAQVKGIRLDTTTGIDGVETARRGQDEVYTLSGRRVGRNGSRSSLGRNIYIVNGKKMLMR